MPTPRPHPNFNVSYAIERMKWLKNHADNLVGTEHDDKDKPGLKQINCIKYVIECISHAYMKSGEPAVANEIVRNKSFEIDGGNLGVFLQKQNGWIAYYWNPDVNNPRDLDLEPKDEHKESFRLARKLKKYTSGVPGTKTYWEVPVAGLIVNYRPTTPKEIREAGGTMGAQTKQELQGLQELKKKKFAYGIAKGATHTFMVSLGDIWEVHWTERGDKLFEDVPLPFEKFEFLSGVVLFPPDQPPIADV